MNRPARTGIRLLPAILIFQIFSLLPVFAQLPPVKPLAGTGNLAGTVSSSKPFQAAKVHALHVDKSVLYMAYTAGGKYQAVHLLPGNYEVRVEKRGFSSVPQKVTIAAGQTATANFQLTETAMQPVRVGGYMGPAPGAAVQLAAYDELFPPDADRALVEKTCVYCHRTNFFPSRRRNASQWKAAVEMMNNTKAPQGAQIPAGTLTEADQEKIVAYLAKHFGPDSAPRALRVDQEFPLDEQALARAMYIEYYLPLDPVLDKDNKQRRAQEPWIGEDGVVWYTDRSIPNRVGYVDPRTGQFKDYVLPDPKADPHGLITDGLGNLFWAETRGLHLGRLDIKSGKMTRYSMDPHNEIPGGQGHTPVMDSKTNIWFTVIIGNRLGVWDRKTEQIKTWDVPTYNSFPYGIVIDKNDKVWMAEFHGCKIAKFDPVTEKFTEYPAASLTKNKTGCLIRRLGLDDNLGQVFYGVFSHGTIGQIDMKSGETTETPVPMPFSEPYDTWADGKGNAWVSDGGQGGALILFNLKSRKMTYYPTAQITDQPKLDISRDGGVWYSPRSSTKAAVGVLYPDVTRITALGAYR